MKAFLETDKYLLAVMCGMQLYDNGQLDALKRKWNNDISQCGDNPNLLNNNSLSLNQFAGLFYMLLIFVGVAFLWATGEHIAFIIARR